MATHSLAIAKATLLASCLRPDKLKVSRDDLSNFHNLLEKSVLRCSPSNIQKTKAWLLQYILPSATRTAALSKYLLSVSKNIVTLANGETPTRACRRQLHLLYLVNDILHHVQYHDVEQDVHINIREHVPSILPELFANATKEEKKGTIRRLHDLIEIWASQRYCEASTTAKLREVLSTGRVQEVGLDHKTEVKVSSKELPWNMPPTHGDPTSPFFDLPAANLMPHIMPNSSRPLRPNDIRALQLAAGPADDSLVNAVKDFLKDVNSIEDPYAALENEGIVPDIDQIGQIVWRNETDDLMGDTYYGWSRAFCEKMKKRGTNNGLSRRGRSRSSSSGKDHSHSPRKRRRYSSSRSRSSSRHHSRSPIGFEQPPKPPAPGTSNYQPYSPIAPPRFSNGQQEPPAPPHSVAAPPPAPAMFSSNMPPFRPPSIGINGPVPPPRPLNWQGPWPPPPPPPPPPMGFPPPFPNQYPPQQNYNQAGYQRR